MLSLRYFNILQTQWDETGSTTTVEQPKHQRSASWGSPDVKEVCNL